MMKSTKWACKTTWNISESIKNKWRNERTLSNLLDARQEYSLSGVSSLLWFTEIQKPFLSKKIRTFSLHTQLVNNEIES